jgi:hypothetical protein
VAVITTLRARTHFSIIIFCAKITSSTGISTPRSVEIREHLKAHGGEKIQIISKIENQEGLNNFDEILEAAVGFQVLTNFNHVGTLTDEGRRNEINALFAAEDHHLQNRKPGRPEQLRRNPRSV